jgi:hypothetical protein
MLVHPGWKLSPDALQLLVPEPLDYRGSTREGIISVRTIISLAVVGIFYTNSIPTPTARCAVVGDRLARALGVNIWVHDSALPSLSAQTLPSPKWRSALTRVPPENHIRDDARVAV